MAIKAINNFAGPDRLIPILLIFSAYVTDALSTMLRLLREELEEASWLI